MTTNGNPYPTKPPIDAPPRIPKRRLVVEVYEGDVVVDTEEPTQDECVAWLLEQNDMTRARLSLVMTEAHEARTNGGPLVIAQGKCSGDAVVTIRTQEEYVARYGHPSAMLEPGGAVTSVPIYDATEEGRREGKMPVVIMGPKDGVGKLPSARIYELESWEAIPRLDALIAYLDEQATKGPK